MLKVGIIGFGLMGRTHFSAWQACDDAEVVALCDTIFADGSSLQTIKGNIGDAEAVNLDGIKLYTDCDEMFGECELDAVSITLPTFLHKDFTVKAIEAGVNVLCEKPMALNVDDCRVMADTAGKHNKVLQIGHCIRFWPEYIKAKEIIDSGKYGKLIFGNFYRLSPNPGWSGSSWFNDEKSSGGMTLDLHIHDTDFILYLLGTPRAVSSSATKSGSVITHIQTNYIFDDDITIMAEGSWAMAKTFPFRMGFIIGLEKATLEFNSAAGTGLTIFPDDGEKISPEIDRNSGYINEIVHFAAEVSGRKMPEVLTPQESMQSVAVTLAEKESAANGKPVQL